MKIQKLFGNYGQVIAILEDDGANEKRITTPFGKTVGRYFENVNRTYDANDRLVGEGNLLLTLI